MSKKLIFYKISNYKHNIPGDVSQYYRGWYDPIQNLLSVVPPAKLTHRIVPSAIERALRQKFGQNFEIKLF
jgi:hypothetical protein